MTKYEELYGVPVDFFPNEKENVKEKLRLATKRAGEFHSLKLPYTYENQCKLHELNQAISWCKKILDDIEG